MVEEKDKLKLLRDILLIDDREVARAINDRIDLISDTLEKREKLSKKVDPLIDQKIDAFIEEIPTTLGPTITKTLKEEIENSKEAVVEALYPIMGKMIKRYVQNEIKRLSESINAKVNNTFSFDWFKRKAKSTFTGVNEGDLILSEIDAPKIEEVFVVEKGSGLLLGNYSRSTTIDKDMISGMLTAIKSFVEDAFAGGAQNLEAIEYELYSIHIQNFYSYYVAVVVSGNYNRSFESELENQLLEVSDLLSPRIGTLSKEAIDVILREYFEDKRK